MIFETLAAMADRANDNKDNYNSTPQQANEVLQDVDNDGLNGKGPKQLINFGTESGNCPIHGKNGEYKHYIVGMQQKQPQSVIQANQDSSSSSSSSSSSVPISACAGGLPEILITVTGTSQSQIRWCGEVWNLPADSGQTRAICPVTTYVDCGPNGTACTVYQPDAYHRWRHKDVYNSLSNSMEILRKVRGGVSAGYRQEFRFRARQLTRGGSPFNDFLAVYSNFQNGLTFSGGTNFSFNAGYFGRSSGSAFYNSSMAPSTGINGIMYYLGSATYDNYHIPWPPTSPNVASSFTAPDGTIYSWENGVGW